MRRFSLIAAAFTASLALYARFVEPNWIEVTRHEVEAPVSRPIKLAHLTDLHMKGFAKRHLRLVERLAEERPDAIVVTGDCVSGTADYDAVEQLISMLQAPLGVWVVRGNWEHWRPPPPSRGFRGARLLDNAAARLVENVWLVGVDDAYVGTPDLDRALAGVPRDAVRIALFHSPAFFTLAAPRISLALAGHSHGGQIRLPLVGALWLPPRVDDFVAGWYDLARARLYVSRGLGTSILDVRFLCRPELPIITLIPAGPATPGRP